MVQRGIDAPHSGQVFADLLLKRRNYRRDIVVPQHGTGIDDGDTGVRHGSLRQRDCEVLRSRCNPTLFDGRSIEI